MNLKRINLIRCTTVIAAVVFIIIGTMRGENTEVLNKATKICLQCIGIG